MSAAMILRQVALGFLQHPAGGNWEVTLMLEHYYFNLTDGEQVIHDEDGVQA